MFIDNSYLPQYVKYVTYNLEKLLLHLVLFLKENLFKINNNIFTIDFIFVVKKNKCLIKQAYL
ncbi:hypothetical protein A1OE_1274 [Candidatus Endolissoclinum faulkneri L2]|uniref:Uncharacterized protein n=1 Tax=Candidatus Endolissoclinum faulkneri L2 TaxID=1193729 RepID=K7Z5V1_9PROT|nr:hypothetical protein A1OE_1274 [Candidatus Endolissoclinum faulkneri L2]